MHAKAGESDRAIKVKMVSLFPFAVCSRPMSDEQNITTAQTFILRQAQNGEDKPEMTFGNLFSNDHVSTCYIIFRWDICIFRCNRHTSLSRSEVIPENGATHYMQHNKTSIQLRYM